MQKDTATSMQVVTRTDTNESTPIGARALSDRIDLVTNTLDIGQLKQGFATFVSGLQSMIDTNLEETSQFQLNTISFCAEITATGQFNLLGTGAGVSGSSSITFVLQRKQPGK